MASWFYMNGGLAAGPADEAELAALAAAGRISGSTSIRGADEQAWSRLDVRLPDIAAAAPGSSLMPLDAPAASRWKDTLAHPWRRYFARTLDNFLVGAVMGVVLFVLLGVLDPPLAKDLAASLSQPGGWVLGVMLNLVLVIPANMLLVGLTGFTLGKWIFGVRILQPDGRPIGVVAAFGRELEVWVQGLGIGVPIVSLVTLVISYKSLADKKFAPWDSPAARLAVHRPAGLAQTCMGIAGVILLFVVAGGLATIS